MPQLTFQAQGSATPQADDEEVMSIVEFSSGTNLVYQVSFPRWVKIVDLRVPNNPLRVHQFGLWFKGAKKPGNFYVTDLNPNQAGRMIFEMVETVYIQPGTMFQIKTAQQSGESAEPVRLSFVYREEAPRM